MSPTRSLHPITRTLALTMGALACLACPKERALDVVDAGAASTASERVVFTGAAGWEGGRACTDVRPEDGCDSQWLHTSGQVVRVFVVPVKDPAALAAFVDKLAADVAKRGGVVDRFTQAGLTLVRFLEPVASDALVNAGGDAGDVQGADLVAINYALVGRDQRAVHLITSVVAFAEQQPADARVRELLGAASWTLDTSDVSAQAK